MRKGSITVFLSLLLPLLLALVGTLLEAARYESAKPFLTENTSRAMQMMFADYNKELWEDYHLFAFTGEDEEAESEIKRAILASLSPNRDQEKGILGKLEIMSVLDFWRIKLNNLSIATKEMIVDEEGDILKHEAAEFMKYQVAEGFVEELLKLFKIVKQTKSAARVSEQKLETEQKLYQYSKEMLELMELIDGIDFGKNGVQYWGDKLKVKNHFVKQFLYGGAKYGVPGIEDGIVLESLKNKYYNPQECLEALQGLIEETQKACLDLERYKKRLLELQLEQETLDNESKNLELGLQAALTALQQEAQRKAQRKAEKGKDTEDNGSSGIESTVREYERQLSNQNRKKEQIKKEGKELNKKIEKAEKVKTSFSSEWKKKSQKLKEKVSNIKPCIEKALELIPKLKVLQEQAREFAQKYQNVLDQEKGGLSQEMYQSFEEDCKEVSLSLGIEREGEKKEICDLNAFSQYLQENSQILSFIETFLSLNIGEVTVEALQEKARELQTAKQEAKSYHILEFTFSYKMVGKKQKQQNPMDTLKKLKNTTLLSLVVKDEKKISKNNTIGQEKVFSSVGESNFLDTISDTITEISAEGSGFSSIFGEFSSSIPEKILNLSSLSAVGQAVLQEFLLNGYVQNAFYSYISEEKNEKESVLRYEQEYILSGKEWDKDNLASSVKKITAVRTICNYISLLADSSRQKEAYTAAIAIVGFTGLEPLVEVLKSVILLVWAYEEGVVDTAALLQGKKLPVIKQPSELTLSFEELLLFKKTLVQKKAAEFSNENKTGIGYLEYLYLFFCIQKQKQILYRMADIIQFNMKKRYHESFLLKEAVFGCKVKGDYFIPTVFFRLPFVTAVNKQQMDGWEMEVISEYAY